jgi:hypothetical protein
MPALFGIVPHGELSDARFRHLIGMEASVLTKHRRRKSYDQPFRRRAELECRATSLAA